MRVLLLIVAVLLVASQGTKVAPSRCQLKRAELTRLKGELKKAQDNAAKCKDEDFACIDKEYGVVQHKRRNVSRVRRQIRKDCASSKKKKAATRCRFYRRAIRLHKRALRRCVTETCKTRHRKALRKHRRGLRRCRRRPARKCSQTYLRRWTRKMQRRRRRLHRRARRCAGNSRCVRRYTMRVLEISKAIQIRRARCVSNVKKVCTSRRFQAWLKAKRAERTRLHDASAKCKDEDTACIRRNMRKILFINTSIRRRRAKCVFKQTERMVLTSPYIDRMFHVISDQVWKRALTCDEMRKNWKLWLNNQRERRARLHDSACLCSHRDTQCIKDRFHRILRLQAAIRRARSEYIKLVESCDKCAPLRERFARWQLLQQQRRDRLHEEICRCEAQDTDCVTERVTKIKQIGERIKQGRAHIFKMNEHCITSDDVIPTPKPK